MEIWGEKILEKYGAKFYRILRANLYGEFMIQNFTAEFIW